MWLLNTTSKCLEFYQDSDIPPYAILSHRWEVDEVIYEDMLSHVPPSTRHGWRKVSRCCEVSAEYGFQYLWIDTCCIDKKSSAELSEAINSMYTWYASAQVCFVYLYDVHKDNMQDFGKSSWFTRSWTLQELLAPRDLIFFNSDWEYIGDKKSLANVLKDTTGIPAPALDSFDSAEWPVALKLSWAHQRKATRTEDLAYSLLGLFDINMPLLYGEGVKAFQRLQEEIMRTSNDLTLFIWEGSCCLRFGVLAASPACFSPTTVLNTTGSAEMNQHLFMSQGYQINNAGISLSLDLAPYFLGTDLQGVYVAYLRDPKQNTSARETIRIFLQRNTRTDQFRRVTVDGKNWLRNRVGLKNSHRTCRVLINKSPTIDCASPDDYGFIITGCPAGMYVHKRYRKSNNPVNRQWEIQEQTAAKDVSVTIGSASGSGIIGYMSWESNLGEKSLIVLCFGFDFYFRPICLTFVFSGEPCQNPMMGVHPQDILNKYLSILPDDSSAEISCDERAEIHAIRGREREIVKRDVEQLGISIRFMPTTSAKYRFQICDENFGSQSDELPARSIDSMTRIRSLFGASDAPGLWTLAMNRGQNGQNFPFFSRESELWI